MAESLEKFTNASQFTSPLLLVITCFFAIWLTLAIPDSIMNMSGGCVGKGLRDSISCVLTPVVAFFQILYIPLAVLHLIFAFKKIKIIGELVALWNIGIYTLLLFWMLSSPYFNPAIIFVLGALILSVTMLQQLWQKHKATELIRIIYPGIIIALTLPPTIRSSSEQYLPTQIIYTIPLLMPAFLVYRQIMRLNGKNDKKIDKYYTLLLIIAVIIYLEVKFLTE